MKSRKAARPHQGARCAVVVAIAAAVFAGCDGLWSNDAGNCDIVLTCEKYDWAGSGGGTIVGCVPSESDAPVADYCGVFVSLNGNDGSAGTKAEPVKTLEEAIARASEKGGAVYACAEEFAETAEVSAGLSLFGGLDCGNGWAWIGDARKTILAAPADAIALHLRDGERTTRIEDVVVRAANVDVNGGSSIAVLVENATVELTRCELLAGNGADGAEGESAPSEAPMQAPSGNDGQAACSDVDTSGAPDETLPGGAQVLNECTDEDISIGGRGGDGNVPNGGDGGAGTPRIIDRGKGGTGEVEVGWDCSAGGANGGAGTGANGTPGDAGTGASGLGTLSASGYAGPSGGSGTAGKPGQGGGGGGGAKGGNTLCGGVAGSGASGGSGGAGGCAGLPGQGGGAGGSSIALASVGGKVTLKDCTLKAGKGGNGGAGGNLQPGALGGLGGLGGAGVGGSKAACRGGDGGQGGNGGPGGGGLGGHSLTIAFHGEPVIQQGATTLTPGAAGAGGPGGSNNVGANAGADGVAAAIQEFP